MQMRALTNVAPEFNNVIHPSCGKKLMATFGEDE